MKTLSAILFAFVVIFGCQNQLANGQSQHSTNSNLISSMLSVATSLFNYASQLVNQVNTAKIQLTQAANSIAFQLRNANNQEILTFLTSLRNELSSNVEQLISTYSPSNVMNFILSAYQSFLGQLSRQTAELRSLTSLYNTKILNSRARDCWTNFRQASNAIYSAAGANFTGFVENETRAVQGQLDSVRNQIQQEVQTISILFRSALQNPSNAVQLLTQYIQSNGEAIRSQIGLWSIQFQTLMRQTMGNIRTQASLILKSYETQMSEAIGQANQCLVAA